MQIPHVFAFHQVESLSPSNKLFYILIAMINLILLHFVIAVSRHTFLKRTNQTNFLKEFPSSGLKQNHKNADSSCPRHDLPQHAQAYTCFEGLGRKYPF